MSVEPANKLAQKSGVAERPAASPKARFGLALIPLLLLGGLVGLFAAVGPAGVFPGEFPPIEELTVGRVVLEPGEIQVTVTNGGPSPVTIAQVLVDDAFWSFETSESGSIPRLGSRAITIPYPWVEGEPVNIALVSSTGVTFEHEIPVATQSPTVDLGFLGTFALLGIYIGLVPVLLGMTWMPFLRTLPKAWLNFFLAFTAGVLVFLGVETLVEAIEKSDELPGAVGGLGLVAFAAVGSFALILAAGRLLQKRRADSRMAIAVAVAGGIGLHNLGEGLAVGAAYRLGEIALGAFLVIGFAVHNTTEGLGIVSIFGNRKVRLMALLGLGLLAGAPTVAGAWIGAFFFSPVLACVFLSIAAGAIAQVVVEVLSVVRAEEPGGLSSAPALAGIGIGVGLMYLTGVLIAA